MDANLYINGKWIKGKSDLLNSICPTTEDILWQGHEADPNQAKHAMDSARDAFDHWSQLSFDVRFNYLEKFQSLLIRDQDQLALLISKEVGKPLWEAKTEVTAMINKIAISKQSFLNRTPIANFEGGQNQTILTHKAHGVFVVLGPYNFPGHLPNGHIIPALMAGNTVVFKPSELTPMVAEAMVNLWHEVNLPKGVLNLVYGRASVGEELLKQNPSGVLFTGSYQTGKKIHAFFAGRPEVLLALEMGGNNPLIISEVENIDGAAFITIMSSFITSGQRCTCARRLLVPDSVWGDKFISMLSNHTSRLAVGRYSDKPEPFMGPVISKQTALNLFEKQQQWQNLGANIILSAEHRHSAFLTPGIVDVTSIKEAIQDEELFGPLLKVYRYGDFNEAIELANKTHYGLASGLISDDIEEQTLFFNRARAGIVNINKQLTGASSSAPFGGVGYSGNHRASAYYAADFCAFPKASMIDKKVMTTENKPSGLNWD